MEHEYSPIRDCLTKLPYLYLKNSRYEFGYFCDEYSDIYKLHLSDYIYQCIKCLIIEKSKLLDEILNKQFDCLGMIQKLEDFQEKIDNFYYTDNPISEYNDLCDRKEIFDDIINLLNYETDRYAR